MPNNSSVVPPETPATNSSESKGFFAGLTNAVANLVPGNNKNKKPANSNNNAATSTNNSKKANNYGKNTNVPKTLTNNAKPVTAPLNAPTLGGAASVNYRAAHMQPSEAVMDWATTADAPMPSASEMRGVAHGGTRRNRNRRNKTGGSRRNKNRSRRNKTGGNRRNKNRSRRNKTGGNRRNKNRSRRNRRN